MIYNPNLEAPEERPYPFVYFISIINDSNEALTIWGRKWILKDVTGEVMVVEGSGVVGENPFLLPGERFSYNSYHVIGKDTQLFHFYGLMMLAQSSVIVTQIVGSNQNL